MDLKSKNLNIEETQKDVKTDDDNTYNVKTDNNLEDTNQYYDFNTENFSNENNKLVD